MSAKKKKILMYSISALAVVIIIISFINRPKKFDFLETSFLHIMQQVDEESRIAAPDLSIESVSLRKIADPSKDFNYYKFFANIVIRNYGGDLENAKVVLSGDNDQKNIFIKNSDQGLSLKQGQNFIIDKYEVLFDGSYNGGTINLKIELKDQDDSYLENNSYPVDIFELPVQIDAISLENIAEDGEFKISYSPSNFFLNTDKFQMFTSDSLDYEEDDSRYGEIMSSDQIYGYNKIKATKENISDSGWSLLKADEQKPNKVKFSPAPFEDETTHFVYVKAVNPENNYYAVSNIISFGPQKTMTRAEFAKLFVDYANVKLYNKGDINFTDVSQDSWYAPYVQTLYNLGLLSNDNFNFHPDEKISRAAALLLRGTR